MINISFENDTANSDAENYELMAEGCTELDRIDDIADDMLLNLDRKVARTSEEQGTTLDRECAVTEQELVQLEADSNARVGPGAMHSTMQIGN